MKRYHFHVFVLFISSLFINSSIIYDRSQVSKLLKFDIEQCNIVLYKINTDFLNQEEIYNKIVALIAKRSEGPFDKLAAKIHIMRKEIHEVKGLIDLLEKDLKGFHILTKNTPIIDAKSKVWKQVIQHRCEVDSIYKIVEKKANVYVKLSNQFRVLMEKEKIMRVKTVDIKKYIKRYIGNVDDNIKWNEQTLVKVKDHINKLLRKNSSMDEIKWKEKDAKKLDTLMTEIRSTRKEINHINNQFNILYKEKTIIWYGPGLKTMVMASSIKELTNQIYDIEENFDEISARILEEGL